MLTRSSTFAILLLTRVAHVSAQSTASQLPNSLPACAQTCTALTGASSSCASNQATYQSCFCQSALLTSLKASSPANICAPQCADADFATIASWYSGQCGSGAAAAPATTATTLLTSTTPNAGSAPTAATVVTEGAQSAATSTAAGSQPNWAAPPNGQAWFSSHWRWVVMLIVLLVGFIILAILLRWLYRRHLRRREEAENAGPRPAMEEWAPNQRSVHDVTSFGAGLPSDSEAHTGKGKGRETTDDQGTGSRKMRSTGSKRLKKSLLGNSR